MQTNGYAFTKNIFCEFDVILKDGQSLTITPEDVTHVTQSNEENPKEQQQQWKMLSSFEEADLP